jgi:hypothetical protein
MAPRDATGRVIRTGDVVKVLGVPNLARMSHRAHRASRRVFAHIIDTYKRVAGFNEIGWVELSFRILHGPDAGLHTVWIEPELLRVRRPRR